MSYEQQETPIVTFVTRVGLSLEMDPEELKALRTAECVDPDTIRLIGTKMAQRCERVAAIMELLIAKGFMLQLNKLAVHGYSNDVEAQDIKRCMLDAGFKDREFQLMLEYTRGWGML